MRTICLDYETYYKKKTTKHEGYSVKDLGNWAYCNHPEFDPFLLSATDEDGSWAGHPDEFNWEAVRGCRIIAHNAAFDKAVTKRLVELGRAPAWVLDLEWQCTANMTSCLCGNRNLKDAAMVLLGKEISKGVRDQANGKHKKELVEEGLWDNMVAYSLQDTQIAFEIWQKHNHRWNEMERNLSLLTLKQCERGLRVNVPLLDEYIQVLHKAIFMVEANLPWTERGAKPTSPIAINEECRKVGIPAPPTKEEDEEGAELWIKTYGPIYSWAYSVGHWRQLGKLRATLLRIKSRLQPGDIIDFSLLYFGGHTGRWSGGGSGFNLQNMRKIPIFLKDFCVQEPPVAMKKKEFDAWVKANTDYSLDVRNLIIARPGKKFICADSSQIEPRVLAWLCGNTELLNMLRGDKEKGIKPMAIYEAFARVSMGWTGGNLKDENDDLYQLAKIQVLGLGYGCGWEKFIEIAAGYGVKLTEEESRQLVHDFRQNNSKTTAFWDLLGDQFIASEGHDFEMVLPSGRIMQYRMVKRLVRNKKDPKTGKYKPRFVYTFDTGSYKGRQETYGGKLTENIVQAVARDIFAYQLLILEDEIGDVIFHVHDEAITEVDMEVPVAAVEEVMSRIPAWAEGLPVKAEGHETPHYLKK